MICNFQIPIHYWLFLSLSDLRFLRVIPTCAFLFALIKVRNQQVIFRFRKVTNNTNNIPSITFTIYLPKNLPHALQHQNCHIHIFFPLHPCHCQYWLDLNCAVPLRPLLRSPREIFFNLLVFSRLNF